MSKHAFSKQQHALSQYLNRYSEPEATEIAQRLPPSSHSQHTYQHCLVIPCYNETDDFVDRLCQTFSGNNSLSLLVIIVINQPDSADSIDANQALWNVLIEKFSSVHLDKENNSKKYHWLTAKNNIDFLLVDRFSHVSQKIPAQQGVGLARKIGSDIACQLFMQQRLENHWVHHSDADTHLPEDYFSALHNVNNTDKRLNQMSAAVYPYTHIQRHQDQKNAHSFNARYVNARYFVATQLYEKALAYYVNGLEYANSPYAFHTLGSCIASNLYHYAQVRGFPKKAGGEDFYLLNKLAKVGTVITLDNAQLKIDARHSDRVPFGTGPAVEKILAMESPEKEYRYYNPQCFRELKEVLEHFDTLFQHRNTEAGNTEHAEKIDSYHAWLSHLSTPTQTALKELNIHQLFAHINKQINSHEQCIQHCHQWLDGFKTLKFIHLLEASYPKQPLVICLQHQW